MKIPKNLERLARLRALKEKLRRKIQKLQIGKVSPKGDQFKALSRDRLAKLSIKELQVYSVAQKKHLTNNAKLIAEALKQGIRDNVKTL
jgi:hypothetical protein